MLLRDLVEAKRISFHQSFATWEEAVTASCQPLLDDGTIEPAYIEAIIQGVNKYGPYIVFAPDIAMPHAQEGATGVNGTAIAFMKVTEPVDFQAGNPDKKARLFFVLASVNHEEHIKNMEQLACLLLDQETMAALLAAENADDLLWLDDKLSGA